MNPNHTDITIILDRSGSMESVADATIDSFNKFVSDQAKAPGTADLTLHQFDDEFETVYNGTKIKEVRALTRRTFKPRGSTALLDAIGRGINETGKRLEAEPEKDRAGKVVFVILTDGYENASTEFTSQKIAGMIRHQREVYSWEFVFLGANQDAIMTATHIGVAASNAMTYASNAQGTQCAVGAVSSNLRAYRCGEVETMGFTAADRHAQEEAGL